MTRYTRRGAVALIGTGSVLLAADSFGFSQVMGNRAMNVSTGDRETSLIALIEADYNHIPHNDFETVAYLRNNLSDDVEVDYTLTTNYPDYITIRFDGQEGGTVSGAGLVISDEEPIELECTNVNQLDADDERLLVTVEEGRSTGITIQDAEMALTFVCGGPILEILDVDGLSSQNPDHYYEVTVEVEESNNEETENFNVRLEIDGDEEGVVYDETHYPGDFSNDTVTVEFDIGQLPEDNYEYVVTADADNANSDTGSGQFTVTDDDLPPEFTLVNVDTTGQKNATIEFTVENEGEQAGVIEALSVDNASGKDPIDHVSRTGNEFERTDGGGALNRTLDVPSSKETVDVTATVSAGETATFELGAFREQDGDRVNMGKGEADITLYLDDDSEHELTLEP